MEIVRIIISIWLLIQYTGAEYEVDCSTLRMGQYICNPPDIDPDTQQPKTCDKDNTARYNCTAAEGIICKGSFDNSTFEKKMPCKYTSGYSFETALLLSIFLGMFGVDRFYLGYPAIGLLKLSTLGFMFLGQLVDIILIATQTVKPSDGTDYIISYYGPGLTIQKMNNETFKESYRHYG